MNRSWCQESIQWRVPTQYSDLLIQFSANSSPVHLQCSQQCSSWSKPTVQLSICEQWSWNFTSFHDFTGSAQWTTEAHSLCSLCSADYVSFEQSSSEDFHSFLCCLVVAVVLRTSVATVRPFAVRKQCLWHLQCSPVATSTSVQCCKAETVARWLWSGYSVPQSKQSVTHASWYQCDR